MSPIGKLFIVLNLALAAVFVGAAASLIGNSQDWRQKYETETQELNDQLAEKDQEIARLTGDNNTKADEISRLLAEKASLESQLQAANDDLATKDQENADLRERLVSIDGRLGDLQSTNQAQGNQIAELNRRLESLRDERDAALDERDSALEEATAARAEAREASSRLEILEADLARLRQEKEAAETALVTAARMYGFDPAKLRSQPQMEGIVLEASYDGGTPIVMVNLGARDEVRVGYTFDVYNGPTYKGQIRIEVVNESNSAATVVLPGAVPIQAGDRITTSL